MTAVVRALLVSHVPKNRDAGASRVYQVLADGLRERGHEVVDLHLGDSMSTGVGPVDLLARRLAFPQLMSRAARHHDALGFDVVMGSSGMVGPLFARLRRAWRRPLLVNHLHGLAVYDHVANTSAHQLDLAPASRLNRWVTGPRQVHWDDRGIRLADLTVVQNRRDESHLATRYPACRASYIPPCLAPELEHLSARARPARGAGPAQLLWFGTWEARKGAHLVPAAFRAVRRRHPGTRLVVGGTSRPADEVRAQFAPEDRAAVDVLGHVPTVRQAEIFCESDVLLFPSLSEGFGLAMLEAAAFGCVPVTTATGVGADHVVDGEHGLVVAPTSAHLAAAVGRLLDAPRERAAMSQRAAALAASFTSAAMVDAYEELFGASVELAPVALGAAW